MTYKKTLFFLIIVILLLSGAYFTLGGFGRSGPDAAPNLAEYGLVGFWNMEEGKGQTVYDRSGNGNNGTLGASTAVAKDDPVFTSGYSSAGAGGTGLKFDGVNDYVDAGNAASLNITNAITVEAWVKASSWAASDKNKIIDKTGNENTGYMLYQSWGTMYFRLRQGYTSIAGATFPTSQFPINEWHHLTGVWDGTNISIYLDGIRKDIQAGTSPTTTTGNLMFGRDNGVSQQFFSGSIDEVRIYNRALSADEIRQHYNQKKPVLEWKFDEGSGTTTKDESFNNNDGTLHE